MEYIKRVQGGLLGLALGDAFGYQVEKMNYNEIIDKYGENGIFKCYTTSCRGILP